MLILRNPAAAEDATQEAYLSAFRAWTKRDPAHRGAGPKR